MTVELFDETKAVDVTGMTKGRGTAGVMMRHNFKGQRATHGVKKVHRHGGGTSMNTFPAASFKGKTMAGRLRQRAGHDAQPEGRARRHGEQSAARSAAPCPGPNGGYVVIRATNVVALSQPSSGW